MQVIPAIPTPRRNRLTRIAEIDERKNPELPAMVKTTMEATRILVFPILSDRIPRRIP